MHLDPVDSSNVAAVGYDPDTRTLRVRFHSGGVYDYAGVPPEIHAALMAGESKGGYLARAIRPHYAATRVETRPMPAAVDAGALAHAIHAAGIAAGDTARSWADESPQARECHRAAATYLLERFTIAAR